MVGGRGVRMDTNSRVRQEPFFLAIDIDDHSGEARVRQASAVDAAWLVQEPLREMNLRSVEDLLYHPSRRQVEARLRTYWIDLVIDETPIAIQDTQAAALVLAREASSHLDRVLPAPESMAGRFAQRIRWLAAAAPQLGLPSFDSTYLAEMVPEMCSGIRRLDDISSADWLSRFQAAVGFDRLAEVNQWAPAELELPNGKRHLLQYLEPGQPPVLAVRIQELFGVIATPRIAGGRVAVLLHLLGPNHRPQQVTSDLASFWQNTYPDVKKELRRRYPKHSWPDDPLTAAVPHKPHSR